MNPDQQDPNNQQQNDFVPPAPGPYSPPQKPQQPQQPIAQPQQPSAQLEVDNQIAKKKLQGRLFLVIGAVFIIAAIVGLIILLTSLFSSDSSVQNNNLDTEEQLKLDVNRLGLAIINYNSGNETFTISPENTSQLTVAYIGGEFNDPRTNEPYILTTAIPKEGEIQYVASAVCNPDDSISQSNDDQNFAIRVLLEGENQLYCLEKSEVQQFSEAPKP